LLDDAVVHEAARRTPDRREVGRDLVVDGDVRRAARRQLELVQVTHAAAPGADPRDLAVGAVVDDVRPASDADLAGAALPPGENRLAAIVLHTEIGRLE